MPQGKGDAEATSRFREYRSLDLRRSDESNGTADTTTAPRSQTLPSHPPTIHVSEVANESLVVFERDNRLSFRAISALSLHKEQALKIQEAIDAFAVDFASVARKHIAKDKIAIDEYEGTSEFFVRPFPLESEALQATLKRSLIEVAGAERALSLMEALLAREEYPGWGQFPVVFRLRSLEDLESTHQTLIYSELVGSDGRPFNQEERALDARPGMNRYHGILGELFEITDRNAPFLDHLIVDE